MNYIFTDKLEPEAAKQQVIEYLANAGFDAQETNKILEIIEDAHTGYRGRRELTREGKAVADADTLFKALPITPILFASKFITQNKYDISKLAHKIVDEQEPLMKKDEYFYTKLAKDKYMKWANTNLQMWRHVLEALEDESVREMLDTAKDLEIL